MHGVRRTIVNRSIEGIGSVRAKSRLLIVPGKQKTPYEIYAESVPGKSADIGRKANSYALPTEGMLEINAALTGKEKREQKGSGGGGNKHNREDQRRSAKKVLPGSWRRLY